VVHPLHRPAARSAERSAVRSVAARLPLVAALIAALAVVLAGAASAHVHVDPDTAAPGGDATVSFTVPNETDDANTTKVEVEIPTDHPIGSVSVEAIPGWTVKVDRTTLAKPIQTDDGEITETASKITWSGGSIAPDQFQNFTVSFDSLPDDVDSLVFPTVQTYSNGDVVRWIDRPTTDGTEPEHPAPVLTLAAAGSAGDHATTTTEAAGASSEAASTSSSAPDGVTKDDVDSAKTLGIVGIVVGAVGLLAAAGALVRKPKGAARS
jgi:uncharacterized protein